MGKRRFITASILFIILIPAFIVPVLKPVIETIFILLAIIAMIELFNMYDTEKVIPLGMRIFAIILMLILYAAILNTIPNCDTTIIVKFLKLIHLNAILNLTVALLIIFIVFMSSLVFVKNFSIYDLGKIYISIFYVGVCISSITALRALGVRFIIYLFAITSMTDTFALVFGLKFGKHKMAPHISPKKTWEGAIGGTLVATVIGFCIVYFYIYYSRFFHKDAAGNPVDMYFFDQIFMYRNFHTEVGKIFFVILLTIFLSVCSQIGDLIASRLKRNFGIKDYSNVFPGHGGVLDRFDSAFFASAIFLVFMMIEQQLFPWVG